MANYNWDLTEEQRKQVWDYIETHDWSNYLQDNEWYFDGVFKSESCGEAVAEALGFTTEGQLCDCVEIALNFKQYEYERDHALIRR